MGNTYVGPAVAVDAWLLRRKIKKREADLDALRDEMVCFKNKHLIPNHADATVTLFEKWERKVDENPTEVLWDEAYALLKRF